MFSDICREGGVKPYVQTLWIAPKMVPAPTNSLGGARVTWAILAAASWTSLSNRERARFAPDDPGSSEETESGLGGRELLLIGALVFLGTSG